VQSVKLEVAECTVVHHDYLRTGQDPFSGMDDNFLPTECILEVRFYSQQNSKLQKKNMNYCINTRYKCRNQLLFMSMGKDLCLWTAATNGPFVHPQMIYEYGEPRQNDTDIETWRTRRKTCPSVTLSTTNPTWIDPGTNTASAVRGRWLTALAMARLTQIWNTSLRE
jgi:hypothetical protein